MPNNSLASISRKGLTGHWSKYGGNHHDIFESQNEDFSFWICQSCGREFNKEFKPYFYQWPEGEYIRVCGKCVSEDCVVLKIRLEVEF